MDGAEQEAGDVYLRCEVDETEKEGADDKCP